MTHVIDRLAVFVDAHRESGKCPKEALDVMRLCLLDWAVVGLAAEQEAITGAMMDYANDSGGEGSSSLFFGEGQGQPWTAPRLAALVNGTISHTLDFDDTHFAHIGHVSTVVFPAALAMVEAENGDLQQLVQAALIGAEVATRVGVWLGRSHYQTGFHQTATAGAFGAAIAAAVSTSDVPSDRPLRIVAGMAAGLKQQFGTAMKPMNAGMAAAHGVESVLLARHGLDGSHEAADGAQGFGNTHHGENDLSAFDTLGQAWLFPDVTHKFHPCCHGTHAMIEAMKSVLGDQSDLTGRVRKIELRTNPRWMSVCNKPAPADYLEAKFSYTFLAALLLRNGAKSFGNSDMAACFPLDETHRDCMSRVTVIADENVSETAAELVVHLSDGSTLEAYNDLTDPLPFDVRLDKLMEKGRECLGGKADDLWAAIQGDDLKAFTALMRRGA